MTIVESGWNLCVWLVGVVVRRYIDFLILLFPTPRSFLQQHPYFLFIFLNVLILYNTLTSVIQWSDSMCKSMFYTAAQQSV